MNSGGEIWDINVGTSGILVALVKRKIGQGSYKPGGLIGRHFMITFFFILCNMEMDT